MKKEKKAVNHRRFLAGFLVAVLVIVGLCALPYACATPDTAATVTPNRREWKASTAEKLAIASVIEKIQADRAQLQELAEEAKRIRGLDASLSVDYDPVKNVFFAPLEAVASPPSSSTAAVASPAKTK